MACGCGTCTNCKRKGGKIPKRKNAGGYLIGPSHEDGGILASFEHSGEMIELEGGEYIINAQTVQAVGVDFLDQLNSTATTHHEGGYNVGELPSPSNYKKGGKLPIKKYDEGGDVSYTDSYIHPAYYSDYESGYDFDGGFWFNQSECPGCTDEQARVYARLIYHTKSVMSVSAPTTCSGNKWRFAICCPNPDNENISGGSQFCYENFPNETELVMICSPDSEELVLATDENYAYEMACKSFNFVPDEEITMQQDLDYSTVDSNGVTINMYTWGWEYQCPPDHDYPGCGEGIYETYVGPYHRHPTDGFMVGAEHSDGYHPPLTPHPGVIVDYAGNQQYDIMEKGGSVTKQLEKNNNYGRTNMRKGGRKFRRGGNIKKYPHGGPHARFNQFTNRRTGEVVPSGAAYHMHPEQGPMEGAVHNPDIPGGTAGHDFYDEINGNGINEMNASQPTVSNMNSAMSSGYRRGGRMKKMTHGGMSHTCPPGQVMDSNGNCVSNNSSNQYKRGGRTSTRRMQAGGYVIESTGMTYDGDMVNIGGQWWTAESGVKTSNSQPLIKSNNNTQLPLRPMQQPMQQPMQPTNTTRTMPNRTQQMRTSPAGGYRKGGRLRRRR